MFFHEFINATSLLLVRLPGAPFAATRQLPAQECENLHAFDAVDGAMRRDMALSPTSRETPSFALC